MFGIWIRCGTYFVSLSYSFECSQLYVIIWIYHIWIYHIWICSYVRVNVNMFLTFKDYTISFLCLAISFKSLMQGSVARWSWYPLLCYIAWFFFLFFCMFPYYTGPHSRTILTEWYTLYKNFWSKNINDNKKSAENFVIAFSCFVYTKLSHGASCINRD